MTNRKITRTLTPALLAGAAAAAVALAPAAGAAGTDDCAVTGASATCVPAGHSTTVGTRTGSESGYWPFSAQSGDHPAPNWVME